MRASAVVRAAAGKDIRFGVDARQAMLRGVERTVAAIATTLGPKGRNVIIEQPYGAPKITKDGVTVAKSIEFSDAFENMGAQLVRQVCNKTNDVAGDGTTTSAVLVASVFTEGFKCVQTGTNPVDMKRGIDKAVAVIVESLEQQAKKVQGRQDIVQVATISANGDKEIGELIGLAMEKVGAHGVIQPEDGKGMKTELEVVEGMSVDRGFLSPYFMTDIKAQKTVMEDAQVFVSSKKISSIQTILPVLNYSARTGKPLLIIADDIDGDALATMVLNKVHGKLKVVAVKAPGFGDNKAAMLQDIAIFSGAQVIGDETGPTLESLAEAETPEKIEAVIGKIGKLTVDKDKTVMLQGGGDAAVVKERMDLLKGLIEHETSDYNREKLTERLAKLGGGVAVIRVGGASEVEVSEKKDRIVDALAATSAAVQEGIVAGGGAALLHASKHLDKLLKDDSLTQDQKMGVNIVRNAVRQPLYKIAANAGKEGAVVVEKVLAEANPAMGYEANSEKIVDMFQAGVIDPMRVVRITIVDSTSVAGLLMTTEAAIADAPKKEEPAPAGGMGGGMGGMGGMGGGMGGMGF